MSDNLLLLIEGEEGDLHAVSQFLKSNFSTQLRILDGIETSATSEAYTNSLAVIISSQVLNQHKSKLLALKAISGFPPVFVIVQQQDEQAPLNTPHSLVEGFFYKNQLYTLLSILDKEVKLRQLKADSVRQEDRLNQLSEIVQYSQNGIIITDAKGRIEWMNEASTRLTRYSLEEVKGKTPGQVFQGSETDPESVVRMSKFLRNRIPFQEEILNYTKQGERVWVKLNITPLFNEEGELTNFLGVQEDVTRTKYSDFLLKAITDITTTIVDVDSLEELSRLVVEKVITHFNFVDCVIYSVNDAQKNLTQVAAHGPKEAEQHFVHQPLTINFGEGIVGSVYASGSAILIPDTTLDNRYIVDDAERLSEVAVPIKVDGKVIGVIDSEHPKKGFYSSRDVENLKAVAGVIATKFKAAQLRKEKELTQIKLEETRRILSTVTNNIPGMIQQFALHADGSMEMLYASEGMLDIHELTPAEVVKDIRLVQKQFLPEYLPEILESMHASAKNYTTWSFISQIETPSGKIKWLQAKGVPRNAENGKVIWDMVVIDISKERQFELDFLEKEQILELAVEGADLGIWDLDIASGKVKVNKQWANMLGYEIPDGVIDSGFFQTLIHPDDLQISKNEYETLLEDQSHAIDMILRMKHADGSYRRMLDRGRIFKYDEHAMPVRLVGTIIDVTETIELQEQLQKSLDEKVILLSEIHHRVKNNLAIITGLMHLKSNEQQNEEISEVLLSVINRINSIAGVHELLYNSESFADITFDKYLETLLERISVTLDNYSVKLNLDMDENLVINITQAVPLGLLLNELVTNSFKYAFKNADAPQINFSFHVRDGVFTGSYSDNGPGIPVKAFNEAKSLGFTLIHALFSQLEAEVEYDSEKIYPLKFRFATPTIVPSPALSPH